MIKVKTNKYDNLTAREIKRLRSVEFQLINELKENGFIEVEKSKIRKGVYYYFKKLKSGKKSSISVYLLETEITVLKDEKSEVEEAKKMEVEEITKLNNTISILVNSINEIKPNTVNINKYHVYGISQLINTMTLKGIIEYKENKVYSRINELTKIRNELIEEIEKIENYEYEKTYLRDEIKRDINFKPEIDKKTIIKNVDGKFTSIIIKVITYNGIGFEILDSNGDYSNVSGFKPCPLYYKLKEVNK